MGKRNAAAAIVDVDRLQQFETPPKRMKHHAAAQPPAPTSAPAVPAPAADDSASEFTLSKEFVDGTKLMDLTLKQWRIGKPIGKGSFGEIFLASDDIDTPVTSENAMYVVKIEPHSNGPLFVEIHCLLNTAKRSDTCHIPPGMPEYIASGSHIFKDERYRFLILKRYERDLHSLIKNKRVNPKSIPVVACQILDVLEHLHDQGYVHSDIKAENLMIGKVPQGAGGASVNVLANGRNGVAFGPQRSSNGAASAETGRGGRRGGRKGGATVEPDFGAHSVENGLYQHQEQEMGGRARNLRPLKTVTYRDLSDEDDRSRGGSSAGGGVGGGVAGSKTDRSAANRRRGRKKTDDASFSCSISPRRSGYEELRAATEEAHWNELRQHKHHLRAAAEGAVDERKPTVPLEDRIHLIDFGLASKFMDSSGQHRPFCMDQRRAHDGTLEFTSRDAHMGAHARRSDLECLGYNLVYWSRGFLPWKDEKLLNQPEQVHRMKEYFMTDVREMQRLVYGDDCPAYLGDFLAYVGQLTYDERPDYQHCRSLFHKELKRLGCPVGRNQPLRLDVDVIERLSEPLTAQDEAEITNKINHVKSLMKLGGALFPYRESTLHSKASSPKNLRSKRRDTANGGRNSLAAADGAQAAGGISAPAGGALVASNVVSTRKREKKISCEEIFATDADQIARERVEKEYERAEQMEETVIRYTGRPTYAIQELERKIRTGGGGHNGWCGGGGGGGSGGLEYTESEDYIKGYTKPMMDILRKRQSQLFREIAAANSTANRNKDDESAVKDEHQREMKHTKAIQEAKQQHETKSDDGEAEVEQDEVENNEAKEPCCSEDDEDDEEMEKRLSREKYYHDTDYEVQADEEEEDDELSTVEEEEEEEEEAEENEEEDEEEEDDDQYEEEEDTASAAMVLHNGHATRKKRTVSTKGRPKKAPASKAAHHHPHHKQQEEDTDSDFFNDGGCDDEEEVEEEEEEEEELEDENEMDEDESSAKDEDAIVEDDGVGVQEEGQEDEEEEEDQQDSDFNDQESTTSGSDVVIPGKRRRIVSSTVDGGHRRGSGKKSSTNGRTLKAKVKGRGRKRSSTSSKAREIGINGNGDVETLENGYGSVDGCSTEKSTNKAGDRRHSKKKKKKKKHHQKKVAVAHVVDDEDDGDNARHNGTAAALVTVVHQNHHHNNNNHCNSKAYYGDVDDSSHDMAPPANGRGDGLMMPSSGGGGGESKYRLVKRRKSCLRERIRPTDRGDDYNQQRKQKAAQLNKRRSEAAVLRLSAGLQDPRGVHERESTLNDDEEASCSSSNNVSSVSTGSSSSSSSSSRSTGSGSASSRGSSISHHSIAMSSRGRTGSVQSSVVSEEATFAIASFREEAPPAHAAGAQKRKRGRPRKVPAQPAAAAPVAHPFDTQDSSNCSSNITRRRHHHQGEEPIAAELPPTAVGGCISDASQTRWSRANSSHSNRSAANSRSSSVSTSTTGSGAGDGASTVHHEYGCSGGRLPTLPEDDDFLDDDDDDTRDVDYSPVCTRRKRKALTTATTSTSGSTGTGTGNGISRKPTATAPVRRRNDSSKGGNGRGTGAATSSSSSSSSSSSGLPINHAQGGPSSGPAVGVATAHRPEPEPPQAPVVVAIQPNRGRRFPQHQNYYHPMEEPLAPLHPHHHHHHQHLQHHHPPTMLVRTYSRG